jgi:hypothetical protein
VTNTQPILSLTHALDLAALAGLQIISLAEYLGDFELAVGRKNRCHWRRLRFSPLAVNPGIGRAPQGEDRDFAPFVRFPCADGFVMLTAWKAMKS